MAIFAIAVICVFWLMLAEPIYEIIEKKKHPNDHSAGIGDIIVR